MKLIYFSFFVFCLLSIFLWFINQLHFALMMAFSIAPINLIYGQKDMKDFMSDSSKYKGLKVFIYPPFIFFFLVLTHHWWLS